MSLHTFVLWMLPAVALAIVVIYIGYLAYTASQTRERVASAPPPGPDPVLELERINTELARSAAAARLTLESARETVRKGTR